MTKPFVISGTTAAGGQLYAAIDLSVPTGRLGAIAHSPDVARLAPFRDVRIAVHQMVGLGVIIPPPWKRTA